MTILVDFRLFGTILVYFGHFRLFLEIFGIFLRFSIRFLTISTIFYDFYDFLRFSTISYDLPRFLTIYDFLEILRYAMLRYDFGIKKLLRYAKLRLRKTQRVVITGGYPRSENEP